MSRKKRWMMKSTAVVLAVWMALASLVAGTPVFAALDENDAEKWNTNLETVQPVGSELTYTDEGLLVERGSDNDAAAISSTRVDGSFVFETDVTFKRGNVVNLIFGAQNGDSLEDCLIFKVDKRASGNQGETKLFYYSERLGWPTVVGNSGREFESKDSYHLKVVVAGNTCTGFVDGVPVCSGDISQYYQGGFLGVGTAEESDAVFQNTTFRMLEESSWSSDLKDMTLLAGTETNLTADGYQLVWKDGEGVNDAMAISANIPPQNFSFASDVIFEEGSNVANLIIGVKRQNSVDGAFVYKFDRANPDETKVFYFGGNFDLIFKNQKWAFYELGKERYTIKVEVNGNTCSIYVDGELAAVGTLPDSYENGLLGLGAAEHGTVTFQNTRVSELELDIGNPDYWVTDFNKDGLTMLGGVLTYDENGARVNATGESYLVSDTYMGPDDSFVFETDVKYVKGDCLGLMFGAQTKDSRDNAYIFYMNRTGGGGNWWDRDTRFWKFNVGAGDTLFSNDNVGDLNSTDLFEMNKEDYKLKIIVNNDYFFAYIDGKLVHQFYLPNYQGGYLGMRIDGSAYFQNTKVTKTDAEEIAEILDVQVEGHKLTPEFSKMDKEYSILAVDHDVESVKIAATYTGENASLLINGEAAQSDQAVEVPLEVGRQIIPIKLTDSKMGTEYEVTISIYRKESPDQFRTEPWRDQYHFSPLEGWINDPNGLIYYNDQWHLFYQHIPLTTVHDDYAKHWGHAVSDDLVHWEELPVALAPDELGSIWSGSTVDDPENKSGLFSGKSPNNLLAFFTHMNGYQVQSVAYSEDGGVTWKKYDKNPILTQEDDPLHDGAFRDPNVFWCEQAGKYLMVVAGGPLRIYSSDNLLDWTFESAYGGAAEYRPAGVGSINSECPDLFPVPVDGDPDNVKWVYTGAGEWYIIGDLEQQEINGRLSWCFVPDDDFMDENGNVRTQRLTMGGTDSYAAVSFKKGPEGRVVMIGWMANWGTIKNAPTEGWNGTYTLCYDISLKTTPEGIRLYQTPVKEYEKLRQEPLFDQDGVVIQDGGSNPLEGLRSDQFELLAHLEPEESVTEVGFKVFQGTDQEMVIRYNPQSGALTLDRSRVPGFGGSFSHNLRKNEDGSVDLQIFVDKGSVEVIPNGGQLYGSVLVFPNAAGIGMEAYSVGGDTTGDITIYPLSSIWREETAGESEPSQVILSAEEGQSVLVGEEMTIYARVMPDAAPQAVDWKIEDEQGLVKVLSQNDNSITLMAAAEGDFSVTASAQGGKVSKTINLNAMENPFKTNLTGWKVSGGGNWTLVPGGYQGVSLSGDVFTIGQETFDNGFHMEFDVTVLEGTAFGVIFNAGDNPGSESYMVNFDFGTDQMGQQFRWTEFPYQGSVSDHAVAKFDDTYRPEIGKEHHVEITFLDGKLTYIMDGHTIFDQVPAKNSKYTGGHIGVIGFKSTSIVNNLYVTAPGGITGLEMIAGEGNIQLDVQKTEQEVSVPYETDRIQIRALADDGVSLAVNGEAVVNGKPSQEIPLQVGRNTVTVTSKSLDGEQTYTIIVNRDEQPQPEEPSLDDVTFEDPSVSLEPTFDPDVFQYTASVPNTVESVILSFTGEVKVTLNGEVFAVGPDGKVPLSVGENIIVVTAGEDVYTLVITREQPGEVTEPEDPDEPGTPGTGNSIGSGNQNSGFEWPDSWFDGSGDTANPSGDKENPQSGDASRIPAALVLLAASAGAVLLIRRKK